MHINMCPCEPVFVCVCVLVNGTSWEPVSESTQLCGALFHSVCPHVYT